jgi:competence protein ComEA
MDFEFILVRITPFVKKYWLPLSLALLGLMFFVYGLIVLFENKSTNHEIEFSQADLPTKTVSLITIDIEGAVVKPGVYKLPSGSIIQDALVLADGMAENANRSFVAKNINLAGKLIDSQKIYIPFVDEEGVVSSGNIQAQEVSTQNNSLLININTASVKDLDTLQGIGLITAQKIINSRPYTIIEDLLNKKIVSSKVFQGIKDKISVN